MEMSEAEFWDITPRAFNNKLTGWKIQQKEYHQTIAYYNRIFAAKMINIHLSKIHQIEPTDLFLFDFEKVEIKTQIPSKSEINEAVIKMNKLVKKQEGKPRRKITLDELSTLL